MNIQEKSSASTSNTIYDEEAEPRAKLTTWERCKGVIKSMRRKREKKILQSQRKEVQTTLRELIFYVIFLIMLLIIAFGMTDAPMFYYTNVMSTMFLDSRTNKGKTFRTSATMEDFWSFAQSVMIDNFFWEYWYREEGNENYRVSRDDHMLLNENKLLGLPRLRQLKVRNNSCVVHEDFQRLFANCYAHYSFDAEDTASYPPGGTAWEYSTEDEIEGSDHWGILTTYSGGGYYQDLPTENKANMYDTVQILKENLWITRGSRVIFLDFSVYNANINLFCIVKLIMELPPTGGILPSWSFRTVKLLRYVTRFDYFILACELTFMVFIFYYTLEEIREIFFLKLKYFKQGWNLLDGLIILISYVCFIFAIYRYAVIDGILLDLIKHQHKFVNFDFLGFWQIQYNNAIGMLVFFAWIKVFKFISFNQTMIQLSTTLSKCAKDIAGFAVMFNIVFLAFAQLGHLLFGTQVQGFRDFKNSVFTLLRTILGDFNYPAIEEANRILGPIFFLSYIFFVFFVLLNMFLAIINETYTEVKSDVNGLPSKFVVSDFLQQGYVNISNKLCCRDRVAKQPDKDNDMNKDKLTYNDIHKLLLSSNFTELEILVFFAKYGIKANQEIGEKETAMMLADLNKKKENVDPAQPSTSGYPKFPVGQVSQDEFNLLMKRVEHMEKAIELIINKVDSVITKIEAYKRP